nr:Fc receptor-like protein 5 [Labrus bergylta]
MEVSSLRLLLLLSFLDSGAARVSLMMSPDKSQFFKYECFTVSCEQEEGEHRTTWRVMKRTKDGEVSPCLSSCSISAAFPATDSGEYWCENEQAATSNSVNITVTAGSVILESPGLPVTENDNVTLRCTCKEIQTSCSVLKTEFYKDGLLIHGSNTGHLTLYRVSASDEGLYKCKTLGSDESPESRLTVRAPPGDRDAPFPLPTLFILLRHLLVGSPYLLSTVLLGLIHRGRLRAQRVRKRRRTCSKVVMEMEHGMCHHT